MDAPTPMTPTPRGADGDTPQEPPVPALDPTTKSLYDILVATRNLEIGLFWQRSNYFLGLSSALAIGFFSLKETAYGFLFVALGIVSSALWTMVCLGGKFWQSRWEQRLMDFEDHHLKGLALFAAGRERITQDVRRSFLFGEPGGFKRVAYRVALRLQPSVSHMMLLLSLTFLAAWVIALAILLTSWPSTVNTGV